MLCREDKKLEGEQKTVAIEVKKEIIHTISSQDNHEQLPISLFGDGPYFPFRSCLRSFRLSTLYLC